MMESVITAHHPKLTDTDMGSFRALLRKVGAANGNGKTKNHRRMIDHQTNPSWEVYCACLRAALE